MQTLNKSNLIMFGAFLLVFVIALAGILYPNVGKAEPTTPVSSSNQPVAAVSQRTINVTGTADVMVSPDEVILTVGVETRDADYLKAKIVNDDNSAKVIDTAKRYGIDKKYIQTDYIRAYPNYEYAQYNETTKVSYYNVQKKVVITLKDIGKFENLLSELMTNSYVQIQNIEFKSTTLTDFKNQARKLAIKAAKDKASLITGELGSGIGKPITINEEKIDNSTWYGYWWYGSSWYGYGQPNMATSNVMVNNQALSNGTAQDSSGNTTEIGQIKVTAQISVTFELN